MSERMERTGCRDPSPAEEDHRRGSETSRPHSADEELVALCQRFESSHREWEERVCALAVSSYEDDEDIGRQLFEWRMSWGSDLSDIQATSPQTRAGAVAKFSAALMFFAWSGEASGAAIAFLARAGRELQPFLSDNLGREQCGDGDRSSESSSVPWLGRFARLARFAQDQKPSPKTGLRSQN